MSDKTILLIEDNPDDEALTLRALTNNHILNDVTIGFERWPARRGPDLDR